MNGSHVIQNFDELAHTTLRRDALTVLEDGYRAIETKTVIAANVTVSEHVLTIAAKQYDLSSYERVLLFCIGKCAADAGVVLEAMLGEYLTDGFVLDVRGVPLKKMKSVIGTHPFPSEQNVAAASAIGDMLDTTTERDLVLTVVSGGGSALLCLPNDMKCESTVQITESLMKAGAAISEINIVRKHMSKIQGGWFAKRAYPAQVVSLIFSDVPGDDMSVIASGPTVKDVTTQEDAERILLKYNVRNNCALPHCEISETPKEEKYFENVENILVLTNDTALAAMKKKAQELGYDAHIQTHEQEGEACVFGQSIIMKHVQKKSCYLFGGETTVCVHGSGKGGRNLEVALSSLLSTKNGIVVVAAASDGWDNSDIAGAIADMHTLEKAKHAGLEVQDYLARNASYNFFAKTGDGIRTGRLGSNVADLYMIITE
jgi:glycerate 2-kinase